MGIRQRGYRTKEERLGINYCTERMGFAAPLTLGKYRLQLLWSCDPLAKQGHQAAFFIESEETHCLALILGMLYSCEDATRASHSVAAYLSTSGVTRWIARRVHKSL
jgi:hypothetical protein